MIERILSPELVDAIGWTLLHALWQGALFAILLGLILIVLRRFSAHARYLVCVGMLSAFFLTVGLTFAKQWGSAEVETENSLALVDRSESGMLSDDSEQLLPISEQFETAVEDQVMTQPGVSEAVQPPPIAIQPVVPSFMDRTRAYFNRHLPLIVTLWLLGVLVLQLRFLGQLAYVQRLKSYGVERFPASWAGKIQELEEALSIHRPVRYLSSMRISSPMTIGWLRPAVLFPIGLLDQLKESQVATILAHELAHIKRNDFLVNLLQSFFTTFFFYHPGVWWMSARIEDEREHACDDLAIQATGGRVDYAKTLLQLKENQMFSPNLSMALAGRRKGFSYRIRRLLAGYLGSATYGEGIVTSLIFIATLALAVSATGQNPNPVQHAIDTMSTEQEIGEPQADIDQSVDVQVDIGINREDEAFDMESDDFEETADEEGQDEDQPEIESVDWASIGSLDELSEEEELRFLVRAIFQGDMEMFRYFLDRVEDLNQPAGAEDHFFSPLMAAASEDRTDMLQILLERGADVNYINPDGWTALIEAADEGSLSSARILLAAGADPNLKGRQSYRSAIAMAASEGYPEIMSILIEAGADIDGGFPLHEAAEEGQLDMVRLLVERGVDVNELDEHGITALARAASEDNLSTVTYLLERGADPNLGEHLPIHMAASDGKESTVGSLLDLGGDPDIRDHWGRTPLMYAASDGHRRVVSQLVQAGADIDKQDDQGHTALILAASDGHSRVVRLLLQAGADVDKQDDQGNTALIAAASDDHPQAIRELLNAGADVEVRNNSGHNALLIATSEGSRNALQALTQNLQQDALDHMQNSPELLIGPAGEGHLFMVRQMISAGVNINAEDDKGRTALSVAAGEGHQGIVDYLLSNGAEIKGGRCGPVSVAVTEGHVDVLNRLVEHGASLDSHCSFRNFNFRNDYGAAYAVSIYEEASLLIQAIEENNVNVVRRLLELGVDPEEAITKRRFKANGQLDWGQVQIMTLDQLRNETQIHYETDEWTPLLEAVENESEVIVRFLLEAGANPDAALAFAEANGYTNMIPLLR